MLAILHPVSDSMTADHHVLAVAHTYAGIFILPMWLTRVMQNSPFMICVIVIIMMQVRLDVTRTYAQ